MVMPRVARQVRCALMIPALSILRNLKKDPETAITEGKFKIARDLSERKTIRTIAMSTMKAIMYTTDPTDLVIRDAAM